MLAYPNWLQSTPVIPLLLIRAVVAVAGSSEWALRIVPVAGAIVATIVMAVVLRRAFRLAAAAPALVFLATNYWVVKYTQQVKRYGTDILGGESDNCADRTRPAPGTTQPWLADAARSRRPIPVLRFHVLHSLARPGGRPALGRHGGGVRQGLRAWNLRAAALLALIAVARSPRISSCSSRTATIRAFSSPWPGASFVSTSRSCRYFSCSAAFSLLLLPPVFHTLRGRSRSGLLVERIGKRDRMPRCGGRWVESEHGAALRRVGRRSTACVSPSPLQQWAATYGLQLSAHAGVGHARYGPILVAYALELALAAADLGPKRPTSLTRASSKTSSALRWWLPFTGSRHLVDISTPERAE